MKFWEGRLRSALILVPFLYLAITYTSLLIFFFLVAASIALAQHEFYLFFYKERQKASFIVGISLGFLVVFSFYGRTSGSSLEYQTVLLTVVVAAAMCYQLFFHREIQNTLREVSIILLGVFYLGWLLGHLVLLRGLLDGRLFLLFLFLVNWSADAGAYYIGKKMGKRKLYQSVSPGKTVAGAVGGWVVSLLVALISKVLFLPMLTVGDALVLGGLLGVMGQLGDLIESMLKRSAGVKDSGSLIPSHGGILDKVDSLAFNTPVLFYYLFFVKGYTSFTTTFN